MLLEYKADPDMSNELHPWSSPWIKTARVAASRSPDPRMRNLLSDTRAERIEENNPFVHKIGRRMSLDSTQVVRTPSTSGAKRPATSYDRPVALWNILDDVNANALHVEQEEEARRIQGKTEEDKKGWLEVTRRKQKPAKQTTTSKSKKKVETSNTTSKQGHQNA